MLKARSKAKPKSDKTGENMATPKKLYHVESRIDLSSCQLYWSIGDSRYCKNLFREANRDILDFVQQVHGDVFPRDKTLPQLVCRSCERKVKNAATVEKTIAETQRLLVEKKRRAKRCLELSASATAPKRKNRAKISARTRANL